MIARLAAAARPRLLPLLAAPVVVVALVGVVASGSGGGGSADGAAPPAAGAVAIQGFAFAPQDVTVAAGTEVVWTNLDDTDHSIQDTGGLFPESEAFGLDETFGFTYLEPGSYPYICGIHNYMRGTITVEG